MAEHSESGMKIKCHSRDSPWTCECWPAFANRSLAVRVKPEPKARLLPGGVTSTTRVEEGRKEAAGESDGRKPA